MIFEYKKQINNKLKFILKEKQQDFSNEVNKLRQTLKQEYDLKNNLNTLKKGIHLFL